MTTLLLHALGVYLLLGLGAIIGDYSHPRLWLTKRMADPLSRVGALVMMPWWVVLTLGTMGPACAAQVAHNLYQLVTKGDYDDV